MSPSDETTQDRQDRQDQQDQSNGRGDHPGDDPGGGREADQSTPIVAIGASAGGLEAFRGVLSHLPRRTGLAFVLVQHLDPNHPSKLVELLGQETSIPIHQVEDGVVPEPDHIYIIPPNQLLTIEGGALRLRERPHDVVRHMPMDHFCRSLTEHQGGRAMGVVLSGTASDGTEGLRAIKEAGGVSMVQSPDTAQQDGMPRSAINAQVVDKVLSAPDIAKELARIARHPYVRQAEKTDRGEKGEVGQGQLTRIFSKLRSVSDLDFSEYKTGTIQRRLHRRMMLHQVDDADQYIRLLGDNPPEIKQLYEDLLIHVTRFFRNHDSFEALKTQVFPKLLKKDRGEGESLRVWVPGCSTGEEAYSAAIVLLEYLEGEAEQPEVQIFATDISESAVEHGRAGHYAKGIASDLSPERLRKFFHGAEDGYRVGQRLREMCVFAKQDLTHDPPFSRIDLVLCRNVLIYMGPALQKRLLQVFHYAMRPTGFLMLGSAEGPGAKPDLFNIIDKQHRIYARKQVETPTQPRFTVGTPRELRRQTQGQHEPGSEQSPGTNVQNEANRLILQRYGPPGVVVDEDYQVVHFRGSTGAYLEPPQGTPTQDLLRMARGGLLHPLRTALHEAGRSGKPVHKDDLSVRGEGHRQRFNLEVTPFEAGGQSHLLVLFHEVKAPPASPAAGRAQPRAGAEETDESPADTPTDGDQSTRVDELERELADTNEQLQSIIQDREAANEELQSANEEMLSSNEELQSTNEELDTAREELQATNEELNSLNSELQARNEELSRTNSDLVNVLDSTQIAIVIVDMDLKIRRFTSMAQQVLNLIEGDAGRPLGHINTNIVSANLEEIVRQSIDQTTSLERQVRDKDDLWYALRVQPYKSTNNRIEGAVISLFEVTESVEHQAALDRARRYAETIVATIRHPLVVLDAELRIQTVSRAFRETFGVPEEKALGGRLYDLGDGQWDIPGLREALRKVLTENGHVEDYRVEHTFPDLGHRVMLLNARRLEGDDQRPPLILLAFEDVTGSAKGQKAGPAADPSSRGSDG